MAIRPEFIQTLQKKGYSQDTINRALQKSGYGGMTQTVGTQGLGAQSTKPSLNTFNLLSTLGPKLSGAEIAEGDFKQGYDILDKLFTTQKEKEELEKEKKVKLEIIDRIIDILEKHDDLTGPVQGRMTTARIKSYPAFSGIFGEPSDTETELWNLIGAARVQRLFEIGGTQLPRHEIEALRPSVPDMTLSAKQNIQNLKSLKADLTGFYDQVVETGDYSGGAVEGAGIKDFMQRYK